MASKIRRAQVLLGDRKCELCDTYKDVKWKCGNCDQILCDECKRIHLRTNATKHHLITALEDATEQKAVSTIFCPKHPKQVIQMYCTTCECTICFDCITGDHQQHKLVKLTDEIEKKQKKLEHIINQLKKEHIVKYENTLETLTKNQTDYTEKIGQLIDDIKTRAEELKQEIDQIRDKLIHDLLNRAAEEQECLTATKNKIEDSLKMMKKLLKETEDKIAQVSDIDIIRKTEDIKQSVSQLESCPEVSTISPPKFCIGRFQREDLEHMYGNFVYTGELEPMVIKDKPAVKVNKVSSFKHTKCIHTMSTVSPDEVWVGKMGDKQLQLINKNGGVVKTINTGFKIYRISTTTTGDILATTYDGHHIYKISQNGDINVFTDMSPDETLDIHATNHGDILVGLSKDLEGRVVRLSPQGQTKQVIEVDDNKSKLFLYPSDITQNINGDIWVTEGSLIKRCVIVVNSDGKYRFTYRGPTQIKMEKKFIPFGITHNKYGQILVADGNNGTIHLVDKDGDFIQYILTKQDGLQKPRTVAIDTDDKLWVGCDDGLVFVVKYLL